MGLYEVLENTYHYHVCCCCHHQKNVHHINEDHDDVWVMMMMAAVVVVDCEGLVAAADNAWELALICDYAVSMKPMTQLMMRRMVRVRLVVCASNHSSAKIIIKYTKIKNCIYFFEKRLKIF